MFSAAAQLSAGTGIDRLNHVKITRYKNRECIVRAPCFAYEDDSDIFLECMILRCVSLECMICIPYRGIWACMKAYRGVVLTWQGRKGYNESKAFSAKCPRTNDLKF